MVCAAQSGFRAENPGARVPQTMIMMATSHRKVQPPSLAILHKHY